MTDLTTTTYWGSSTASKQAIFGGLGDKLQMGKPRKRHFIEPRYKLTYTQTINPYQHNPNNFFTLLTLKFKTKVNHLWKQNRNLRKHLKCFLQLNTLKVNTSAQKYIKIRSWILDTYKSQLTIIQKILANI